MKSHEDDDMKSKKGSHDYFLSVVIPAYNEEQRIIPTLNHLDAYLKNQYYKSEIVIVCDGCTDSTFSLVSNARDRIYTRIKISKLERNYGKGKALEVGVNKAEGAYHLFYDADMSTPINMFDKFLPLIERGEPIIVGTRKVDSSIIERSQPVHRKLLGWFYTRISNLLVSEVLSDFTCGFKAFRHDVSKQIFSMKEINGFVYNTEIIFLAQKMNYSIIEVPIRWSHKEKSKINPLLESLRSFYDILRIYFQAKLGNYSI